MRYLALLGLLVGCHNTYHLDPRPRSVSCRVTARDPVVVAGEPVRVRVVLTNDGVTRVWAPRRFDLDNSAWVIDGRDGQARQDDAAAATVPHVDLDANGTEFAGPTPSYANADHVDLAPGHAWTIDVDVASSTGNTMLRARGVDLSPATLIRRALAVPGRHRLELTVRSHEPGEYHSPDYDYGDVPWQAPCNPITVDVRTP
jgi:hypothetical protein